MGGRAEGGMHTKGSHTFPPKPCILWPDSHSPPFLSHPPLLSLQARLRGCHPPYRTSPSPAPPPLSSCRALSLPPGKMAGLTLTPFNAGRMVGGAIWRMALRDGSELLYALDWCHKKER